MPEGKFCNRRPIKTEEELKALLGDKGGQQYYKEMVHWSRTRQSALQLRC